MQECRLKVPGCEPIFMDGTCCPVKYICGKPTVTVTVIKTVT